MAGIDYSQFINNLKSKYAEIVKDKKIALSEFGKLEKADQDKLSELLAGGEAAQLGDIVVVTNEYKSEDGATLELFAGRGEEGEINLTDSAKKKYKNADHGWLENGEMILLDKNGRTLVNTDGAVVKLRLKESDNKLRLPLAIGAVRTEVRQFMIDLLKRMYTEKKDEFTNYLFSSRPNFFKELGMTLHDLGSMTADKLTELGIVVDRGDTRWEIREKLLNKTAELSILEDNLEDEEYFNKKFREYFGSDFNYEAAYDFLNHCKDFNEAKIQDKLTVAEKTDDKFSKTLNNLIKTNLKSADDYMSNSENIGGLMELATTVALMYISGGSSAIAKYSQMAAKGANELAEVVITNTAGKKAAQSVVGQTLSQAAGITAAQANGAAMNAVAFQMPKVAELVGETVATGHVDMDKVNVIAESTEGLFKFGYVGSAISGPLGMQVKGLTTKLLNSKPIINQILTKGITNKPTPLTSVLKDISEHSEAIGEVLKFGTEFGINAGYMAYDDGTSYTDAMKNLAQMDGVSKMVIAMLGGKNLEFLTPKKVQQIKTDLAGYKVNISIYEGQKVYSVKDAKGKETVLATPEELFMFILDKEAQKVGVKAETKAETKTASSKETKNDAVAKDVKAAETTGKKPYVKPEVKVETNREYKANLPESTRTIKNKADDVPSKAIKLKENNSLTPQETKSNLLELGFTPEEIANIDCENKGVQTYINVARTMIFELKMEFPGVNLKDAQARKGLIEEALNVDEEFLNTALFKYLNKENVNTLKQYITDLNDFEDYKNLFSSLEYCEYLDLLIEKIPLISKLCNNKLSIEDFQNYVFGYDYRLQNLDENSATKISEYNKLLPEEYQFGLCDINRLTEENLSLETIKSYAKECERFKEIGLDEYSDSHSTIAEKTEQMRTIADMIKQYKLNFKYKEGGKEYSLGNSTLIDIANSNNIKETVEFLNSLTPEGRALGVRHLKAPTTIPKESFVNILNKLSKSENISFDRKDEIVKMLYSEDMKNHADFTDYIIELAGNTTVLKDYGWEEYCLVANQDYKGAKNLLNELKTCFNDNKQFDNYINYNFQYICQNKDIDYTRAVANIKEMGNRNLSVYAQRNLNSIIRSSNKDVVDIVELLDKAGFHDSSLVRDLLLDQEISLSKINEKLDIVKAEIRKRYPDLKDIDDNLLLQFINLYNYNHEYYLLHAIKNDCKTIDDISAICGDGRTGISYLRSINGTNKQLFKMLMNDNDIPKDDIIRILYATTEANVTFAEKLCADKEFPKDKIVETLNLINDISIDIKTLSLSRKINVLAVLSNINKDMSNLIRQYTSLDVDAKIAELSAALGKKKDIVTIPKAQQKMFLENILANNNKVAENVLKTFDFEQYEKRGLPLKYPREEFTANIENIVKDLSPEEQILVLDHFGLLRGETGFDGLPNNKPFNDENASLQVLEVARKVQNEIESFTSKNEVRTGDATVDNVLNGLIDGLPEFTSIVGKEQHGTHAYSVDIHTLKVLQSAMNNPLYEELSDRDKTILKISALCHDLGKKGGVVDSGHAAISAEFVAGILEKFPFPQSMKDRIIDIVDNHHWFEAYNKGNASAEDVAVRCRRPQDFIIYEILSKADFENVNKDFHIKLSEGVNNQAEFDKFIESKMKTIDDALTKMYSKANLVFDTQFVKNGENFPKEVIDVYGEPTELKVLDLNKLKDSDSLQQYGFSTGVTKDNARFTVHMTDPTFDKMNSVLILTQNSLNQSAWSTSLIKTSNNRTYTGRKFGFVLDVDLSNISEAYYQNTGSGYGKQLKDFERILFDANNEARTYVKDNLVKYLSKKGVSLDDKEYAQLAKYLSVKRYTTQITKDVKIGNKIIKAKDLIECIQKSTDMLFEGGDIHNEIVPINPRVKGLIAKVERLEDCPEEFLKFAKDNNLSIILMKPANEK